MKMFKSTLCVTVGFAKTFAYHTVFLQTLETQSFSFVRASLLFSWQDIALKREHFVNRCFSTLREHVPSLSFGSVFSEDSDATKQFAEAAKSSRMNFDVVIFLAILAVFRLETFSK